MTINLLARSLRVSRHRVVVAAGAGVLAMLVGACSLASPATVIEPYSPGDGTQTDLVLGDGSTIKLRNFVLVGGEAGQPGQLVGAVTYDGTKPEQLLLQVDSGEEADPVADGAPVAGGAVVDLEAGKVFMIGPEGIPLVVAKTAVAAGRVVDVTASAGRGGTVTFTVPVVPASGYYADLKASAPPTTSPAATADATGSPSPTEDTSPSETPTPTETP